MFKIKTQYKNVYRTSEYVSTCYDKNIKCPLIELWGTLNIVNLDDVYSAISRY